MEMNEKEQKIEKNTKKSSKNKKLIVILLIIIIVSLGSYFFIKYKNNNQDVKQEEKKEASLKIDDLEKNAICYDSYNEKDILCKFITLDSKIAYSMDYGCEEQNGETVTFRDYLSDQGMAIMINGYPNNTPETMGCENAYEAYAATQMAMWEVMNRTEESKKATQIFRVDNVTPISGKEEVCERIVKVANKLVKYAEENPYTSVPTMMIDNEKVDMQNIDENNVIVGPYTIDISGTDATTINYIKATLKEAPETARIVDEKGKEKAIFNNGDTVYVKMVKPKENAKIRINFESSIDRKVGEIFEEPNKISQDFVRIGKQNNMAEKELVANITITDTLGMIKLYCLDTDNNPVGGSKFSLINSDGDYLGDVTAGDDGIVNFYKVPEGEYTIKQIEVSQGYELQKETEKFTVKAGETTNVTFYNEAIR